MDMHLRLVIPLAVLLFVGSWSSKDPMGNEPSPRHAPLDSATSLHAPRTTRPSSFSLREAGSQGWTPIHPAARVHSAEALEARRGRKPVDQFKMEGTEDACKPCLCFTDHSGDLVADCSGRKLTQIPDSLPSTVSQLLLADNSLTALGDGVFGKFHRLRLLDLRENLLSHLSGRAFQGLGDLRVLHLHGNRLPYTADVFTAEVLAPLRSLRRLTLHNNTVDMAEDLDYPDLALSRLPLLETLSLDGLTNRSFGEGFAKLVNLRNLSLSGEDGFCEVDSVLNSTFVHLPFLKKVNLTNCKLSFIDSGAFQDMKQIDTLDISNNIYLGFDNAKRATYGLQNSTIRVLLVKELHSRFASCVCLTKEHMEYLGNTAIEEIHAQGNRIQYVEAHAMLAVAKSLRILHLGGNELLWGGYYLDLLRMKKLEVLTAGDVGNKHFLPNFGRPLQNHDLPSPGSCQGETVKKKTLEMYQKAHHMKDTHYSSVFIFPLPPNLRVLSLRRNGLTFDMTHIRTNVHKTFEHLDISGNLFRVWIGPFDGASSLKYLNISQNFGTMEINSPIFSKFPALEVLDISHNLLRPPMAGDVKGTIFANLKALRVLNISDNGLDLLPQRLFHGLSSLEYLNLRDNRLASKGFAVDLSRMSNLSYLDLASNNLDRLTPQTTAMLDQLNSRSSPLSLDLRDNPLSCSCGNRPFLTWLNETHVRLVGRHELQCVHEDGSLGPLWKGGRALEQRCEEGAAFFMGAALGSLVILTILVGLVLYRYRWRLRYLYYGARSRYRREQPEEGFFKYDAFISYSTEDYQWVTRELMPRLQDGLGLRLCLHQRDFLPGRPIAENIVEAVQTSRRTVCVLSQNFLDSQWCLYEMQMAIMEGVHSRRDVLLLLLYDPTCVHALPREARCLMQSDTYLEYPRDPRCLEYFWENLDMAIRQ